MTFTDSGQRLLGARFVFFGFTFLIYLDPAGPKRHVQFLDVAGNAVSARNLIYHPGAINYATPKGRGQKASNLKLSHVLRIDWPIAQATSRVRSL